MRRITPVALILAAGACSQTSLFEPPVYATLDTVFTLGIGDQATIVDAPFQLRFLAVAADSRCPEDVDCVWSGDAVVRLLVVGGAATSDGQTIELHTDVEPYAVTLEGFRISLERLLPATHSETTIRTEDYVAELRVARVE